MEDFGMVQGITSIFGFLAVCVVMMWKIVSDKNLRETPQESRSQRLPSCCVYLSSYSRSYSFSVYIHTHRAKIRFFYNL